MQKKKNNLNAGFIIVFIGFYFWWFFFKISSTSIVALYCFKIYEYNPWYNHINKSFENNLIELFLATGNTV